MEQNSSSQPASGIELPPLSGAFSRRFFYGFRLSIFQSFLTVVTLGIYRFWEKARLRRHVWATSMLDTDPFEYAGTGLEKITGFLVAVVLLAVIMGVFQLVLTFGGLSVLGNLNPIYSAVILQGLVLLTAPLLFFAVYRSHQYTLSRTSWRGIRFKLEAGAWGYALRMCGYSLLSALTLGLLYPLQAFKMSKYITDRTYFGTSRLFQHGNWKLLYGSFRHVLFSVFIVIVGFIAATILQSPVLIALSGFTWLYFIFGIIFFRVDSFRRLTAATLLVDEDNKVCRMRFISLLTVPSVLLRFIGGSVAISVIMTLYVASFARLLFASLGLDDFSQAANPEVFTSWLASIPTITIILLLVGLIGMMTLFSTLRFVFLTKPLIGLAVASVRITNWESIRFIRQGEFDENLDADGFASALDVGGAI